MEGVMNRGQNGDVGRGALDGEREGKKQELLRMEMVGFVWGQLIGPW